MNVHSINKSCVEKHMAWFYWLFIYCYLVTEQQFTIRHIVPSHCFSFLFFFWEENYLFTKIIQFFFHSGPIYCLVKNRTCWAPTLKMKIKSEEKKKKLPTIISFTMTSFQPIRNFLWRGKPSFSSPTKNHILICSNR